MNKKILTASLLIIIMLMVPFTTMTSAIKNVNQSQPNERWIQQTQKYDTDYDFDKIVKEALEKEKNEKTIEGLVLKEYYPGAPWDDPRVAYYVANEVIVGFKSYVDVSTIDSVNGQRVIDYISEYHSVLVEVIGIDLEDYIEEVEMREDVDYAELNGICQAHGMVTLGGDPNDPLFPDQWGLEMINCPQAWEFPRKMEYAWVSILDSGIADGELFPDHEDLKHCKLFPLNFRCEGYETAPDYHGHGTLMAGIILAEMNNGKGIAGVAGDIPHGDNVAVLKKDPESGVATAPHYRVAKGLRESTFIIHPSALCMCFGSTVKSAHRRIACAIADVRGVLLIASAGNGAWDKVEFPALYDTVISVGAINENKELCDYDEPFSWGSNYGPDVDIVAPGVNIISTNRNGGYSYCFGTSAAAAHVVGVALLWYGVRAASRRFPHVKQEPDKCREALFENAEPLGEDCGHGLVDALGTVKDAPVDRTRAFFRGTPQIDFVQRLLDNFPLLEKLFKNVFTSALSDNNFL